MFHFIAPGVAVTSTPARFVTNGEAVTLTCSFVGTAISRSVWFHNGVEVMDTAVFSVTRDASMLTLDISQFNSSLVGDYHCLVENSFGTELSQVVRLDQGGEFCLWKLGLYLHTLLMYMYQRVGRLSM